jgi:hypothetical protein
MLLPETQGRRSCLLLQGAVMMCLLKHLDCISECDGPPQSMLCSMHYKRLQVLTGKTPGCTYCNNCGCHSHEQSPRS